MASRRSKAPTRAIERELWDAGHDVVVGIDEVGRGSWAGPLMVGVAVLPRDRRVNGVRDSKMLTEAGREDLFDRVAAWCDAWAVGAASHVECDELGMADAQLDKMIEDARSILDVPKRAAAYQQMQKHIADQAYILQIYQYPLRWEAWRSYVKGYVPLAANIRTFVRTAWVSK